jgi:hypothetical protein
MQKQNNIRNKVWIFLCFIFQNYQYLNITMKNSTNFEYGGINIWL